MAFWIAVVLPLVCAFLLINIVDRLRNRRQWEMLAKIPGPQPIPMLGNMREIGVFSTASKLLNPVAVFLQTRLGLSLLYRKEKLYLLWSGRKPTVFLISPDTVEPLLSSNSSIEKGYFYGFFSTWLGLGLLTSAGEKWRRDRKLLTPTFHFRILEEFLSVMNEQSSILVEKLRLASKKSEWLDPFHYASLCTLDIICETAMGYKIRAQDQPSDYGAAIKTATHSVMNRFPRPWIHNDKIFFLTKDGKEFARAVQVMKDFTNKVISEKLKEREKYRTGGTGDQSQGEKKRPAKKLAFLDMLLESDLTTVELREQADTFMFAGHDTTSSALNWILYLLGLHPDTQKKLVEEIENVLGLEDDCNVTQNHIKQLKFMGCVIKETQRLYPSVPGVTRKIAEDSEIGGYIIPKGTECVAAFFSVHYNPEVFPEPERFRPDRFLTENTSGRSPFAFLPFSAGPRNCIGQRFAMMELRVLLCHILRHFQIVSRDPRDKVVLVSEVVLRPMEPLKIKFIPK